MLFSLRQYARPPFPLHQLLPSTFLRMPTLSARLSHNANDVRPPFTVHHSHNASFVRQSFSLHQICPSAFFSTFDSLSHYAKYVRQSLTLHQSMSASLSHDTKYVCQPFSRHQVCPSAFLTTPSLSFSLFTTPILFGRLSQHTNDVRPPFSLTALVRLSHYTYDIPQPFSLHQWHLSAFLTTLMTSVRLFH